MKYVIDRIEGETAVCEREDRVMEEFPLILLYEGAKPGDHFQKDENGVRRDAASEEAARRKNAELLRLLFEDGPNP